MLWVIAAVVAVGAATAAVTVANATGGRDDVLSQDEVTRQLGRGTDAPATPEASGTPQPPGLSPQGVARSLQSRAGQVVARCDDGLAYLEAWSPNPGYRVDDVVRGPAAEASVWIESDSFEDVKILIRCDAGEPKLAELVEPDDHGGNRGPGGGDDDY